MNLPYARLTLHIWYLHTCKQKTVANSLTLCSVNMVHSILNIYKTLRAKIPYLKAPLLTSLFLMLTTSTDTLFIDTTV